MPIPFSFIAGVRVSDEWLVEQAVRMAELEADSDEECGVAYWDELRDPATDPEL
jgi:hypothetical protein